MGERMDRVPVPLSPGEDWYDWLENIGISKPDLLTKEKMTSAQANEFHEHAGLVVQQHRLESIRSGNSSPFTITMSKAFSDLEEAKRIVSNLATKLEEFIKKEGGFFRDLKERKVHGNSKAPKILFQKYMQEKLANSENKFYGDVVRAVLRAVRPIEKKDGWEFRCLLPDMYQEIASTIQTNKEDEERFQSLINDFPDALEGLSPLAKRNELGLYVAHHCIIAICSCELNWTRIRKMSEEERQNPIDFYKRNGDDRFSADDKIPDEWYDQHHKVRSLIYFTDDMIKEINEEEKNSVNKFSKSKARYPSAALRVYQPYPGGYMNCRPSEHRFENLSVREECANPQKVEAWLNAQKSQSKNELYGGPLQKQHRKTVLKHGRFEEDDWERVEDVGEGVRKALNNLQKTQWKINEDFIKAISLGNSEKSRSDGRQMRVFNRDFRPEIKERLAAFCIKRVKCPHPKCNAGITESCRERKSRKDNFKKCSSHASRLNIWEKYSNWKMTLDTIDRLIWHYDKENKNHPSEYGSVFWNPFSCDFRGRLYSHPNLSPQGEDFQKASIVFRESRPLGERGAFWLRVQVCNLYGEMKGESFEKRAKWTEEKRDMLSKIAEKPMSYVTVQKEGGWWSDPRKKNEAFLRLANTIAMKKAWDDFDRNGGDWDKVMSNQPVNLDATVNGYQHISALLRSYELASKVNVIKTDNKNQKSDLYQLVANQAEKLANHGDTKKKLTKLVTNKNKANLSKIYEKIFTNGRSIAKPIVMQSAYGAGLHNQWEQFVTHNGKKNGMVPENPEERVKYNEKWKLWEENGKIKGKKPKMKIGKMWHKASFFYDVLGIDDSLVPPGKQIRFSKDIVLLFTKALKIEAPEYHEYRETMKNSVSSDENDYHELNWEVPTGFKTKNRYPERTELKFSNVKNPKMEVGGKKKVVAVDSYWLEKRREQEERLHNNQKILTEDDLGYLVGSKLKEGQTHPTTRERSWRLSHVIEKWNAEYGNKQIEWDSEVSYIENLNELIKQGDEHNFAKDLDAYLRGTINCTFTISHPPLEKVDYYGKMSRRELKEIIRQRNSKRKKKKLILQTGSKEELIARLKEDDRVEVYDKNSPKNKVATSIAANYVHSLDGAHMAMVVNKMSTYCEGEQKGFDFWAVHDSFGTHAADIDTLRKITLETFKELHENLKLPKEIAGQIKKLRKDFCTANGGRGLDLKDVLDSIFFLD